MKGPNKTLRAVVLGLGYFFLYVPIVSLMVFSFNESPTVTSWAGFSFRWYHALFNDDALLRSAWLSFRIAAMTATAAVIIGTWAGYVLGRMGRFRGFSLYVGMLSAPLVIPEVVLGISLL
ncbi:MAG: putrescine ABC transporter permease PotI, partial [Achromobacter sp.]